jgi:hypothetical protein
MTTNEQRPARGRTQPGLDAPAHTSEQHTEWLIDESVEESFPASDTPSATRPGSVAEAEAASERSNNTPAQPRDGK